MASRGRRKSVGVVEMSKDLGVSTATVSRALNGNPSVRRELGAADAVRCSGRRLPGDLSLVVYGDPAWFVLADPPLTMVQVP